MPFNFRIFVLIWIIQPICSLFYNNMGKKDKRNVGVVVDDDMEEENELEAELQAVLAMRQEKAMLSQDDSADAPPSKVKPSTYNKDGLLKALEELACTTLPFVETLQICDFPVEITDENDDLAREVNFLVFLIVNILTLF